MPCNHDNRGYFGIPFIFKGVVKRWQNDTRC
nr:MAG TPA: hypothetical protein [Caudoviricetes sp.]DAX36957.1 MAG TPA: hypothetical protein [Caudoviricetes sp.]